MIADEPTTVSREAIYLALRDVSDPELDESLVDLNFVENVHVDGANVEVVLRLPTFWCAPNFAYLMAHDARQAALSVPGVGDVHITLKDHMYADEITTGVSCGESFGGVFGEQADSDEIGELRALFRGKAFGMRQEQLVRFLLEAGLTPADITNLRISDIRDTSDRGGLRIRLGDDDRLLRGGAPLARSYLERRRRAGLNDVESLITDLEGAPIASADLDAHLQRTRRQRVSMTFNALMCKGLLETRYGLESDGRKEGDMKAVQLFEIGQPPRLTEVAEPKIEGPMDVIVRITGAGVCRTDLHLVEGVFEQVRDRLPFTLGHENAGFIEEVGSGVSDLKRGDPIILHPQPSCGLCRNCRAGNDMHCTGASFFPGFDGHNGGYAELMRTNVRSVIKLAPGTEPAPLAPFADAGITAYHAVKKMLPKIIPGSTVLVLGVGGLGHFGIQILKAMSPARVIGLDTREERLDFARRLGADEAFLATPDGGVEAVRKATGGQGADIVMDYVGEHGTPDNSIKMLRRGGTYSQIGYGGTLTIRTVDLLLGEFNIVGNIVGTYNDLAELMELNHQGKVKITAQQFPLENAADVLHELDAGRVEGRAVLLPPGTRQQSIGTQPVAAGVAR